MRLIDADEILYDDIKDIHGDTYMIVHAPEIDMAPTVFDKKKVIEELEEADTNGMKLLQRHGYTPLEDVKDGQWESSMCVKAVEKERRMKQEEAIEGLKFNNEKCLEQCEGACFSRKNNDCACQDAVIERMLDELLQYREIGTVKECKTAMDYWKYLRENRCGLDAVVKKCAEYEQVGTVEECREAVEKVASLQNYIEQLKWERDIAEQQLAEIGVSIGQKMDDVKEAMEKQKPKKPDYEGDGYDDKGELIYDTWICPNCGERYEVDYDDYGYCPNCGQAIDTENLEGMEDE